MVQTVPEGQDGGVPFGAFNFHVAIEVPDAPGAGGAQLCQGAFAEVSGLEATMEAKAIRSGGRNYGSLQRPGPVSFATVVLKRGMAEARDLWSWWKLFAPDAKHGAKSRCTVYVTLLDSARKPALVWKLENAMPVKFKAGDLSAKSNDAAIEELHFVHEGLHIESPEAAR